MTGRSGCAPLLVSLLMCAACVVPTGVPPAPAPTPASVPAPGSLDAIAQGVIVEANRERRGVGLNALVPHPALMEAAYGHARELAGRGELDHTGRTPGRETMTTRIEAAGVMWLAAAENLAQVAPPEAAAAAQAVRMWLRSPGHLRNLHGAQYTHTGVGVATNGQHWFIVQLYVRPR